MSKLSLFSQITSLLPKEKFRSIIGKHRSDHACKSYDTWSQLVAMIFCHLGHCNSIRDISNGLRSVTGNLNHLGIRRGPSKSTVAYANQHRDWQVFRDLFYALVNEWGPRFPTGRYPKIRLKRKIFAVDSTVVPLCLEAFDWAHYRKAKGAVKIHTVLDYDGLLPVFIDLTDGKKHDSQVVKNLHFPPGSVVLADRAYSGAEWLNILDSNGVFFVTRLKQKVKYRVEESYDLRGNPDEILSDEDIRFLGQQPTKFYPRTLRLVSLTTPDSEKPMRFLTNNLSWKAETIAELYRKRWEIEIFFKQIKQHLRIKSFVGTSANAVMIQVWTAMITILILKYLKLMARYTWNLSNLVSLIRMNLFVKMSLEGWIDQPYHARGSPQTGQLSIF